MSELTREQIEKFRTGLRDECEDDGTREAFDALCNMALTWLEVQPISDEIRQIKKSIDNGDSTPGGVEHLGDFHRLIWKWEAALTSLPEPK